MTEALVFAGVGLAAGICMSIFARRIARWAGKLWDAYMDRMPLRVTWSWVLFPTVTRFRGDPTVAVWLFRIFGIVMAAQSACILVVLLLAHTW